MMNWLRDIFGKKDEPAGVQDAVVRLAQLDLTRLPWEELYGHWKWLQIQPSHVRAWASHKGEWYRRALCVATLNRDGYVRETAVWSLRSHHHAEALPFVLWALRDWVPQVRTAAVKVLTEFMIPGLARTFLTQYSLIIRLGLVQRAELKGILVDIHQFLRSPDARGAVQEALRSDNAKQRLFVYRLLAHQLEADSALQRQAATDPDPTIRAWFLTELDSLDALARREWLRLFVSDRSAHVACRAIWALEPSLKLAVHDSLIEACGSDSKPVREAARHAIDGWTRADFADYYRRLIQRAPAQEPKPGWIAGLGETGDHTDRSLVVPLLDASRSRLRSEALRASALFDRSAASEALVRGVADSSGRVRRVAVSALARGLADDEEARLYNILMSSPNESAVAATLQVLAARGSWDAVPAILMGASRDLARVRERSWLRGVEWLQRHRAAGWLTPSASTRARLVDVAHRFRDAGYRPPSEHSGAWNELLTWVDAVCGVSR